MILHSLNLVLVKLFYLKFVLGKLLIFDLDETLIYCDRDEEEDEFGLTDKEGFIRMDITDPDEDTVDSVSPFF